jgi:hypothetical protein
MAESNGNGKLPISIVTTVVNKISDFTKEMEILRAQLPDKTVTNDKIDNLDKKLDRSLTVIKTVFVLAMVVIGLSFLGARLLDWHASSLDNKDMIEIITKKLDDCWEEKLKEILEQRDKTRADERNSIDNQVGNLNVKMDRILKKWRN